MKVNLLVGHLILPKLHRAAAPNSSVHGTRSCQIQGLLLMHLGMAKLTISTLTFLRIFIGILYHNRSDHYTKLSKKWNGGLILGSSATLRLVKLELKVEDKFLVPLEMGLNIVDNVRVTLIDANHCPGAVLLLFELPSGVRILHCGDFRASADHWTNPLLLKHRIDVVYLDTTYCDPSHTFPSQKTVLELISELSRKVDRGSSPQSIMNGNTLQNFFKVVNPIQNTSKTLFVVGSYLIGKEKVFMAVANAVTGKVYTNPRKREIYETLQDPRLTELLTGDPCKAKVHVVPFKTRHLESFVR